MGPCKYGLGVPLQAGGQHCPDVNAGAARTSVLVCKNLARDGERQAEGGREGGGGDCEGARTEENRGQLAARATAGPGRRIMNRRSSPSGSGASDTDSPSTSITATGVSSEPVPETSARTRSIQRTEASTSTIAAIRRLNDKQEHSRGNRAVAAALPALSGSGLVRRAEDKFPPQTRKFTAVR